MFRDEQEGWDGAGGREAQDGRDICIHIVVQQKHNNVKQLYSKGKKKKIECLLCAKK